MNSQLKKGVLELCVLASLDDQARYGYEIVQVISKHIEVSEGTIYPLLKRLKDEAYVSTYLVESVSGPARKYYQLTDNGRRQKSNLEYLWKQLEGQVNSLLKGQQP